MLPVYWFEQSERDLPSTDEWLSGNEAEVLATLRFPPRRRDWRLGRWTAKLAVVGCLDLSPSISDRPRIEIQVSETGAPFVLVDGEPADIAISITHRNGIAACAAALQKVDDIALGCDLELIEPHSPAFVSDYFTPEEQVSIARGANRDATSCLYWSAKESTLKALQQGLRLDTQDVAVRSLERIDSHWQPLEAAYESRLFHGWWQREDHLIRTLVAHPQPAMPVRITRSAVAGSDA